MPPTIKASFCNHALVTKKTITFGSLEKKAAEAKGLKLPDHAIVQFCIQCWSVNPTVADESDLDQARLKSFESGPINGG
jgi:hypothetical protein